jgi:type I restriction enzyme S subunit
MKNPAHWRITSLENVAEIQTGLSKSASRQGEFVTLPYLRVANVQDGHFDLTEIKEIEVPKAAVDRFRVRDGDVLLTEGGDFDKLGRGAVWRGQIKDCVHQNHIFVVRPDTKKLDVRFFAYQTQGPRGRAYFQSCSKQSTNLASINSSQLKQFPTALPPLPEQCKIADILTTWDEALTQLDALIEAQERRKKALMQQLLTGRRRLKGFSKPWKYMRMDAVFERVDRAIEGEAEHVLSITAGRGFVDQREKFSRVIAGRNIENYVLLKKGEFSYNKGNSDRYPQGCVYRLEEFEEGAVPNVWISFRLRSAADSPLFYKHFFLDGGLNHGLHRLINAGVRNDGLLNLTASNFFSVLVPTAEPSEQAKLGTLFENLSIEVKNLRDQRRAIDQQKRGLMQRLLTGKLRVTPS